MRIAFLGTSNPEVNATQVRLYHLARGMADAGHQVTVVAPDDPINREFPVTRESAVAFRLIRGRSAIAEIFTKFREVSAGNFDVIHVVGIGMRCVPLDGRPFKRPFYVQDYDEAMAVQEGLTSKAGVLFDCGISHPAACPRSRGRQPNLGVSCPRASTRPGQTALVPSDRL